MCPFSLQELLIAKADYFCPDQPDLFSFQISNHITVLWYVFISAVLFGAFTVERYWIITYTSLNQVLLLHHTSFLRNCKREKICYRNFVSGILFHFQLTQLAWQFQIILWNLSFVETSSFSMLFFENLEVCFGCSYAAMEMLRTLLTFSHDGTYFAVHQSFF